VNWLLDTDVICQPAKKHGDAKVIAWLEAEQERCYTSAVVIAQLAYWVRTKEGRQRQALQAWLSSKRCTAGFMVSTYQWLTSGQSKNAFSTRSAC
jgi:predicted nucleic acid-binding protein